MFEIDLILVILIEEGDLYRGKEAIIDIDLIHLENEAIIKVITKTEKGQGQVDRNIVENR